jgi:transcriptional regulator with XRE-family HTH domain
MSRLVRTPLAKFRMAAGIGTAEQAAKLLDCSRSHLLHIERGRYGASRELMAAMAKIYGVSESKIHEAIRSARKDLARRIADSL